MDRRHWIPVLNKYFRRGERARFAWKMFDELEEEKKINFLIITTVDKNNNARNLGSQRGHVILVIIVRRFVRNFTDANIICENKMRVDILYANLVLRTNVARYLQLIYCCGHYWNVLVLFFSSLSLCTYDPGLKRSWESYKRAHLTDRYLCIVELVCWSIKNNNNNINIIENSGVARIIKLKKQTMYLWPIPSILVLQRFFSLIDNFRSRNSVPIFTSTPMFHRYYVLRGPKQQFYRNFIYKFPGPN